MEKEVRLDKNNIENLMMLTGLQQGMLFHYINDEDSKEYHEQLSLTISGDIEVDLLQKAWDFVVETNEMLRTVFRWRGIDKPVQVVLKKHQVLIQYYDFLQKADKYKAVEEIKLRDLGNKINLEKETLRIYLCKLEADKYEMIISNHHILYDGWSNGIILRELMEAYNSLYKNRELKKITKTRFSEFIKFMSSLNKDEQKNYWSNYLINMETKSDYFSSAEAEGIYKEFSHKLDSAKTNKVKEFARENRISLAAILYSAWGILLQKLSDSNEILFGTTVSGRPENIKSIDNMVGLFINTIPLRVKSEKDTIFIDLIHDIDKVLNERKGFENTSLVDIKEYCGLKANEELFNSIVSIENYPLDLNSNKDNTLTIEDFHIAEQTNYNIALEVLTFDDIEFKVNFNSAAMDESIANKLGNHLEKIINALLINSNIKISEVELLSEKERNQILYEFNDIKIDYLKNKTIQELFEEQAEKTPDNTAVLFGNKKLTYRELNERSNSLARILRNKGVKADTVAAIMVERSPEMIIGIMAILKSGGAYLPIDPSYPQDRIEYMLTDSESKVLLSTTNLLENTEFDIEVIDLYADDLYNEVLNNLDKINNSKNLAYVIYTSGTTGRPKGAMLEHLNLNNFLKCFNSQFNEGFGPTDRVLSLTNYAFDVSVCEFFIALTSGAALVINDKHKTFDPIEISKLIVDNKITFTYIPPSLLLNVYEELESYKSNVELNKLLVGVEAIKGETISKFYKLNKDIEIVNGYGPTEATICSTFYKVKGNEIQDKSVPIGRPVGNTSIYILNSLLKVVPAGIAGEIFISGTGVARGYLNKPELTAERFVDNPFEAGTKMYKTGDLARWLPDGNIEFLGRADNQVKIRGYRVELGEVENRLLKHESIREAAVVIKENKENEKFICAYLVSEKNLAELNLKSYLKETLPEYMVPAYIMQVEKMPLTANGKLNKRGLPEPNLEAFLNEYEAPRNETEETLSKIWSEVLGVEKIGINDNFFELGGHSLKATVLMTKLHKKLNKEIPLKELFKSPTIKELSEFIEGTTENPYSGIEKIEEKEYHETSSAQKRMYMLQQFDKDSTAYNMPVVFELEGKVDKQRIEDTFRKLILRHEALRTYFETLQGEIIQRIDNTYEFKLMTRSSDEDMDSLINEFVRPFEPEKAPLFRTELVSSGEKTYLLIDMHHVISDGLSMSILIKDFVDLYNGQALEPLKLQYKDFAAWQNSFLKSEEIRKQEEYWVNRFIDEIPVLNMPLDYERPAVQSFEGDRISFALDKEITKALRKLSKETGCTMHMILLSVFYLLLSKYSGQEDIVIGVPAAGRLHAELQDIMGMFVNTLALRNKPQGKKKYIEFLKEVRGSSLSAYENQSYQFEQLVDKLDIRKDASRNQLFDVMFNMIDAVVDNEIKLDEVTLKQCNIGNKACKFDLTLSVLEKDETLEFEFEYCVNLFKKETILRMNKHYTKLLENILESTETEISKLDMLTEEERKQIIRDFNNTKSEYFRDKAVFELFEEQAQKTPNKIAVEFEERKLTYKELNDKSNSLAWRLREKGVKADSIVGIKLDHSIEMLLAIMAVLKAGGAYLPIDPGYPKERVEYILADSNTKLLLTIEETKGDIDFSGEIINLSNMELYNGLNDNLPKINTSRNLAYVIYTSGTTGNPKGVMIEHKGLVNYISWANKMYLKDEDEAFALFSSIAFDLTVTSIFTPLISGHKIVIYSNNVSDFVLYRILKENKVTVVKLTPAHLTLIKDLDNKTSSVRRFIVGGDELKVSLAKEIHDSFGGNIEIYNEYGPTETVVGCMLYKFDISKDIDGSVSIGCPADNVQIYIVDKNMNLQTIGIPGELCISGDGLARGYLNRAELTAEKFAENPFEPGKLLYKTGDLAKWHSDGTIEYLGRIDNQVKIRGYRIELGEIESRLLQYEGIKEVAVLVNADKGNEKNLCAYIVCSGEINISLLREYLKKSLPEYMVPAYFVRLESMPLTSNGKVDKRALPEPKVHDKPINEYEAPRNEAEETLVKIWSEVLEFENIGINDNFFELGGHSLKIVLLVSRIKEKFNIEIQLKEIFKLSTIKEQAKYIESLRTLNSSSTEHMLSDNSELIAIDDASEKPRLYEASHKMRRAWWRLKQSKSTISRNINMAVRFKGELNVSNLEQALNLVIERHEALRTTFVDEEILKMKINNNQQINLITDDNMFGKTEEAEIQNYIYKKIRVEFNFEKDLMLKAWLFRIQEDESILIIVVPHLIGDGWTMNVIINDLITAYKAVLMDDKHVKKYREKKVVQFKEYTEWLNNKVVGDIDSPYRKFWETRLKGKDLDLRLPFDCAVTDKERTKSMSEVLNAPFNLDNDEIDLIKNLNNSIFMSKSMLYIAISNLLLVDWCKTNEITVTLELNGRPAEHFNTVGYYVNTIFWRFNTNENDTMLQYLQKVRDSLIEVIDNQYYPDICLETELGIKRDINVLVNFMMQDCAWDIGVNLKANIIPLIMLEKIPFDFMISSSNVVENVDTYAKKEQIYFTYHKDLYSSDSINILKDKFRAILKYMSNHKNNTVAELLKELNNSSVK